MHSTRPLWQPEERARNHLKLGPNTILAIMRPGCLILTATTLRSSIRASCRPSSHGGAGLSVDIKSLSTARSLGLVFVAADGGAELDGGEAEFVAELVGGFGEFFEFFAAARIEEFELFGAVRKAGEGDAEEADFAVGVAGLGEEIEEFGEDAGVQMRGFVKSF